MAGSITSFTGVHAFLSNFHRCKVVFDGAVYPSAEHAYQAAKTQVNSDREKIRLAGTPALAKRFGRLVHCRKGWDEMKISVMRRIIREKFKSGDLRARLLATGDAALVEGNWWGDTFWGVCQCRGENHLGKLLMEIRAEAKACG